MVSRLIIFQRFILRSYSKAIDGWTARRFNQVSTYGAWLDVVIDNVGRGILWTRISSVIKNVKIVE